MEQKLVKFKLPEDQTGPLTFGLRAVEAPRAIMRKVHGLCVKLLQKFYHYVKLKPRQYMVQNYFFITALSNDIIRLPRLCHTMQVHDS